MQIDYTDTEKLLEELDKCTKAFRDVTIETAKLRGEYEKLSAEEKVVLAFAFNSLENKTATEKDKVCRLDKSYQSHIETVAKVRNEYFISFAKLEALKHRMEYLKTRISLTQTLIKLR